MGLERLRQRHPAPPYVNPSGTLILLGLPEGFPPFLAAVMYLRDAVRGRKEHIRLEYGSNGARTVEFRVDRVYHEAKKRKLIKRDIAVAPSGDLDVLIDRSKVYSGAAFASAKEL